MTRKLKILRPMRRDLEESELRGGASVAPSARREASSAIRARFESDSRFVSSFRRFSSGNSRDADAR